MKTAFSCILLALVCATSTEGFSGGLKHHIHCWSVNPTATNQWCMDSCFNPGAPSCPSGFCDCNCDAGDPGCPRKLTIVICM